MVVGNESIPESPREPRSDRSPRIISFQKCSHSINSAVYQDIPNVSFEDELAMMVMSSPTSLMDKLVHGIVAFMSTLGFEMLCGRVYSDRGRVSFMSKSFRLDEQCSGYTSEESDEQLFSAYFKRPAPKTSLITHRVVASLLPDIRERLEQIVAARSADWQTSLCSEDLAGIKELTLIDTPFDPRLSMSNDFPVSMEESRRNHRVLSQPLQGFGHRAPGQLTRPRRYRLVIIGVNQAGFLTFVHNQLLLSGFRIIEAEIETIRGSYASNTYIIETYSTGGEQLLRANFQCVVPVRSITAHTHDEYKFIGFSEDQSDGSFGVWLEDGLAGYVGALSEGRKNGFGRFFRCQDKTGLSTSSFEGDFVNDSGTGFGFKLTDDSKIISYSFGKFVDGRLVDGTVLCPFEPPVKSLRVDPSIRPDQCVYRTLIQRTDHWRRQIRKCERPVAYLPSSKVRSEYASRLRASWTMFAESPVPCTASMHFSQVAALLEVCGLGQSAKQAFAKRIDGRLLEAMTESHLRDILCINSVAQRNMFIHFLNVLAKAQSIDRHMRQPASVLDALVNPSISGRLLPLEKMRVVDSVGEGAYGKVMYAEFQEPTQVSALKKTTSFASVPSIAVSRATPPPPPRSPRSEPSLMSALTRRNTARHDSLYVALKEQIGSGAQLENSCELVREWATLNALPHENIVKLEGICADANAPMFNKRYLATALIEASLPSLIYAKELSPVPPLTPLLTLQLAGDIASGLAHMHSLLILHGDIKSPNVLVDLRARDRPVARLCDFGHAAIRVGPRPQRRMCTFGWASPESLRDAETDLSADVWSWAVVCWEMYTKQMPWRGCSHAQMLVAVGYCGLSPAVFTGHEIPERVKAEKKMKRLCQSCWNFIPADRPGMDRVLAAVDKLGRASAAQAFLEMQSFCTSCA